MLGWGGLGGKTCVLLTHVQRPMGSDFVWQHRPRGALGLTQAELQNHSLSALELLLQAVLAPPWRTGGPEHLSNFARVLEVT